MRTEQGLGGFEPAVEAEKELQVRIETYTDEYKDKVSRFFDEIEKEYPEVAGAKDVRNIPEYFQKDEAGNFWVAVNEEGDVIGTAGLQNYGNKVAYISRLYIRKDLRQKRVGSKLTDARKQFAEEHGYRTIFSATMPENEGVHKFAPKRGFKRTDAPPPGLSAKFHEGTVFFQMDLGEDPMD